jgi:hypothetical protein
LRDRQPSIQRREQRQALLSQYLDDHTYAVLNGLACPLAPSPRRIDAGIAGMRQTQRDVIYGRKVRLHGRRKTMIGHSSHTQGMQRLDEQSRALLWTEEAGQSVVDLPRFFGPALV